MPLFEYDHQDKHWVAPILKSGATAEEDGAMSASQQSLKKYKHEKKYGKLYGKL